MINLVPQQDFDFARDTGFKSAEKIDWPKEFAKCARVIDVRTSTQLSNALATAQDRDGIRLEDGLYVSTARRAIRANNVVVGPKNSAAHRERGVTIDKGQIGIYGDECLFGGVRVTSTVTAMPEMFVVAGKKTRVADVDIVGVRPKTDKGRVFLIKNSAHESSVSGSLFENITGFACVLDVPRDKDVAKLVVIRNNDFVKCSSKFFQAAQWTPADSFGQFAFNSVRECSESELKVSRFSCRFNDFYRNEKPWNFRIGDENVLAYNRIVGGRTAVRVFGARHSIVGNIISEMQHYGVILCEGSLQEQFREHKNAHHVVASDVLIEGNMIYPGGRGAILVGDRQTGMRGVGRRGADSPDDADWPHYEPYSPQDIRVLRNIVHAGGRTFALRRPDTRANTGDNYPDHAWLNKYSGLELKGNIVFADPSSDLGNRETKEFIAWRGENFILPTEAAAVDAAA